MAREWIDEPAIVRRDQLAATRRLEPSRIRFDADQVQRDLAATARQRASVASTMQAAAQRIEWANQRLASYDRPFKRHRHSFDISSDLSIIVAARAAIDDGREQLVALEAKSRRLQREVVDDQRAAANGP